MTKLTIKLSQLDYRLISLHNYRRPIFVILMTLVEYRNFKLYGGSLSEYFYGLTRLKRNGGGNHFLNALESALKPVVIDILMEQLEKLESVQHPNSRQFRWKSLLKFGLQSRKAIKSLILILNLVGWTKFATIWQFVSNQIIIRMPSNMQSTFGSHGLIILMLTRFINSPASSTVKVKLAIPPPPKNYPTKLNIRKGICPVCNLTVMNPAMSNGYVCCYPCLVEYIQEHSMCPVTLLDQNLDGIYKIYQ